jgi:hypothetical protein
VGLERAVVVQNTQKPEMECHQLGSALGNYVTGTLQDDISNTAAGEGKRGLDVSPMKLESSCKWI